jgi:pyruvate/2-oxoglutarate/acetoin dehydrogenase E1 component
MSMSAESAPVQLSLREAILEGISEEMTVNPDVVVVGQDVREFGGPLRSVEGLWHRFGPEQVIQTPVCESGMVSMGVGMALGGCRPIIEIMFTDLLPVSATPLIQLAANYRYLSAGKGTVPLVVRARGGDGHIGRTHRTTKRSSLIHRASPSSCRATRRTARG